MHRGSKGCLVGDMHGEFNGDLLNCVESLMDTGGLLVGAVGEVLGEWPGDLGSLTLT